MNLIKDIKFSNDLIENENCTITYSGYLFKNNSESVTLVYGFDNEWKNTTELLMEKTKDGFIANIKILSFSNLNFCFRNSNYEWDNNFNSNFSVPITKQFKEDKFIINEEIIDTLLENIAQTNPSYIEDSITSVIDDSSNKISTNQNENTIPSFEITPENEEFIEIEDSIGDIIQETELDIDFNESQTKNIETEKQNTEQVEEFSINSLLTENLESNEELFSNSNFDFFDDISDLENDQQLDNLIDDLITDLYSKTNDNLLEDENNITTNDSKTENLENINEISESNISNAEKEPSLIEDNVNNNNDNTTTALIETDNIDNYLVSPRSLSKFYMMKKKIKLAFYKLLALPKILLSNFGNENNN